MSHLQVLDLKAVVSSPTRVLRPEPGSSGRTVLSSAGPSLQCYHSDNHFLTWDPRLINTNLFSIFCHTDFNLSPLHVCYFVPMAYTTLTSLSFAVCILRGLKHKTKQKPNMSSVRDRTVHGSSCYFLGSGAKSGAREMFTELNQIPSTPLSLLCTLPITCYFQKPAVSLAPPRASFGSKHKENEYIYTFGYPIFKQRRLGEKKNLPS